MEDELTSGSLFSARRGFLATAARVLLGGLLSFLPAAAAHASWPERPVTVIVPFAAGGFTDMLARLTAKHLSEKFGQSFVVENRTGAGGAIAANYVMNARPDGYTLFMASVSQTGVLPHFQNVTFDPDKYERISIFGKIPFLLAVKSELLIKTIPQFVAYAKANPGKMNISTAGVGATSHLVSVMLAQRAGLDLVHVPYKGSAPSVAAVISGEVDGTWGGVSDTTPHMDGGRVNVIASSSEVRIPALPNLPTLTEFYPGAVLESWNGYLAPPGTPKEITQKLTEALIEIGKDKAVVDRLTQAGITPTATTAEEMDRIMQTDKVLYGKVTAAAGVQRQN
jgi:tripartite-type tricarboxylate transporter receptor subunit TctC